LIELDRVSFSGHETFPFRTGWLKKGYAAAAHNPRVFSDQDKAMTLLGVGKNMVRSVRHWCLATRLLKEGVKDGIKGLVPTDLGRQIFETFDPYLEDSGTLWLVHWSLVTNAEKATTWYSVFSGWFQTEFTKEDIVRFLQERLRDHGHTEIAESSIRRDVDCFVRTYVPARATPTLSLEDALDCPLTELNLISELSDRKTYRFQRANHPTLPDLVLAYMLLEFWEETASERESLSFEDLMYKPGSPGRVLRFEENAMIERLERMEKITAGVFTFTTSAGLKQLLKGWRRIESPVKLLEEYYIQARKG
jgi:hypothetical protein